MKSNGSCVVCMIATLTRTLNAKCDLCVTNANIMTRAQVLGGSVIPQTLLFSDGLMAGSSVGGSCEYHQVLETDLLLKCAPGA